MRKRLLRIASGLSGLILSTLLLACAAPASTSTPTPDLKNLQTRIAATIAAIPTAESLTPRAPTATVTPTSPQDTATSQPSPTDTPNIVAAGEYTVAVGDTLSTIAQKFNTSIAAIQLENNLDNVRVVRLGQRLKIPTSKLAADENPYWIVHVVQPGETLSTIAVKYAIKLDDLLRVNKIAAANASITRVGDRLVIPVSGPVT
jgi:LysM repeat protein